MKVLIVSATEAELSPFKNTADNLFFKNKRLKLDYLSTGAGAINTTYFLQDYLFHNACELIINAGIAGSFNREIAIGETVNVISDCFADLGAEDGNEFLDLIDLKLMEQNQYPFQEGVIFNRLDGTYLESLNKLRKVKAITVNTTTGAVRTAKKRSERFKPDIETMEGCAVFFVARMFQIPVIQLRAISNYVERRNKKNWKIEEALKSLSFSLKEVILELSEKYGS